MDEKETIENEEPKNTGDKTEKETTIIPVSKGLPSILTILPVFQHPVFPGIMLPLIIQNESNYPELDKELKNNNFIGILLVKEDYLDKHSEVMPEDLFTFGTVAKIVKRINLPDGNVNLLINSLQRFEVSQFITEKAPIKAIVKYIEEKFDPHDIEVAALLKTIKEQVLKISKNNPLFAEQIRITLDNSENPSRIADYIASMITDIPKIKQQALLETVNLRKRLEKIAIILEEKLNIIEVQERINETINKKIEKQQREFFLKEQLKAIKKELGIETDKATKDIENLRKKFESIKFENKEVEETLKEELEKIENIDPRSPDYTVVYNYLDTALSLPWSNFSKEKHNIERAKKILEKTHYGLKDVKERILEFLAVRKLKPDAKGSIICFVGPPGVGKTSLGKSIAKSLNREFFRFSVGGMRDEAEIKGHRRTYIGAMPGKIIQGLKIVKTKNPVFMIDEIDKLAYSYQGDPASALLEVLDPEQNVEFRDHYLDLPFDLSHILFITTANTLDTIPAPLLDRMEIIRISGYISSEKIEIGKKFILPKQKEKHGLSQKEFTITKAGFLYIAEKYSREAGVRNFERNIQRICRKIAYKKVINEQYPKKLTPKQIREILGPEIFTRDEMKRITKPGVAIGLAWTSLGGDTLFIESIAISSKTGGLKLTGKLGDVMQESANIAYSYVRKIASDILRDKNFFEENLIHLHVPEGAVPKDGPSAGITMASSLLSLVKNQKIKEDIAMTGELTLTGAVLPVGGIREKVIAAHRAKINKIILPKENERDLEEVPAYIKKNIQFYFVEKMEEVIGIIF
ncbi:MAG TPA: endopeptidase La [Spirochaetota bacterium]|nr:endopeptidase La [Spirochaetota bacterium]HOM38913.1 endopeptidase La [Spirochaetota bacterium]HPQ49108.1 endopeptidase La [Spirochaetota bacterium]